MSEDHDWILPFLDTASEASREQLVGLCTQAAAAIRKLTEERDDLWNQCRETEGLRA